MATFDVSSSRFPGHVVVSLGGELDICGATRVGRALSAAAASGSRIIVDLAERLIAVQADGEAPSDPARYVTTDQAFTEKRPA